ncbi:MAG: hypothetical protein K8J31_22130 [Anaerolineae bacterium]|nr:hypothetical protein [Anaerolineae bacterium]
MAFNPERITRLSRNTIISIQDDKFLINGQFTYDGRMWNSHPMAGLLMNARLVQGIFDDLNPATRHRWAYPDTGLWDAERNVREFIQAMPDWYAHGLLAFTLNLQGGSPQGYSNEQPWVNSAIRPDGSLREDYLARLTRILDRADELGMVVILGIFYFGQERVLRDEAAVVRAVDQTLDWLFAHNYRNVLIEINNECNVRYQQPVLRPERVHELLLRVKERSSHGWRFPVSTSYGGRTIAQANVVQAADFVLMHGNGVEQPQGIADMVRQVRRVDGYTPKPIVFNEDDHFNFDHSDNHMLAAVHEYASWGFFDYRMAGEGYEQGYQSVPVDWGIRSDRKRGFFELLKSITLA